MNEFFNSEERKEIGEELRKRRLAVNLMNSIVYQKNRISQFR